MAKKRKPKKRGSSIMCEKVRKHTRAGKKIKSYGRKRKTKGYLTNCFMFDINNPNTFLGGQNVHNLLIIGMLGFLVYKAVKK